MSSAGSTERKHVDNEKRRNAPLDRAGADGLCGQARSTSHKLKQGEGSEFHGSAWRNSWTRTEKISPIDSCEQVTSFEPRRAIVGVSGRFWSHRGLTGGGYTPHPSNIRHTVHVLICRSGRAL